VEFLVFANIDGTQVAVVRADRGHGPDQAHVIAFDHAKDKALMDQLEVKLQELGPDAYRINRIDAACVFAIDCTPAVLTKIRSWPEVRRVITNKLTRYPMEN